jgi:hypothetical protein
MLRAGKAAKSADQADTEIAENAESFTLASDHQPGEASPQQADDDPKDNLSERWHQTLLLLNQAEAPRAGATMATRAETGQKRTTSFAPWI